MRNARRPNIQLHRARPAKEGEAKMEQYRSRIDNMLDKVTSAKLMRMICDVIHAILMNQ